MLASPTSCSTAMKELTITEQEAAYAVARQRVVVCEGRCEVTAIKRELGAANSDAAQAKADGSDANTLQLQHSKEVNRQKVNLQTAVCKLTDRIRSLTAESLAEVNKRNSELMSETPKQEGEVVRKELNPAYTEFAAKDRALRDWLKRPTNVQYVPQADLEACGAWTQERLNELKAAREKHWPQNKVQAAYGSFKAHDRFPPSMRLYTGPSSGVDARADTHANRNLAVAVDAADAGIDTVVDGLLALKTQYSDQRAATAEALAVAERAHQDTTSEREAATATFSQLKAAESRIVDKVEKARKHVEVATQEAVVAEANARFDETSKAVTVAKKKQTDLEHALAAVKDAESWWVPFKNSVHTVQAAERELWLAGEGLRMSRRAQQEATRIATLATAVTKYPRTPESARLLLGAIVKPVIDVREGLCEARALNPGTVAEHWVHVTALLCALHRSDEDLEKALEQLPTKLATFDKTKNDPVGAKALAARQEAGKLVRAAETKIRALTVELAESTKRLVAQQEMMAELEELWELAKARLALRQLTPFPSC
jgi:hypothetical protein